jgi:gliding motility-associated-like protein
MKKFIFIAFLLLFSVLKLSSQLTVTSGYTAAQYVNYFVGTGVTVSNPVLTGNPNAFGRFVTGPTPTNLGISQGIVLATGLVNGSPALGSPASNNASTNLGMPGDPLLTSLAGATTYDAAILEFDFVPVSDTIKFQYVFASEEYPEWVGYSYNDIFAFFITGPNPAGGNYNNTNIALIPGTNLPVTINNVNSGSYSQYYVDNQYGTTIVYDGFTKVLTAWARVVPCSTYHFKIAIADAGDGIYDSGVFLKENSFTSPTVSVTPIFTYPTIIGNYLIEGGCNSVEVCINLSQPSNQPVTISYTSTGTATPGVDFNFPPTIIIPANQTSVCYTINAISDNIPEGTETVNIIFQSTVGCNSAPNVLTFDIIDYPPLTIITTPDTFVCGDTVSLQSTGSGGIPPYTYAWDYQNSHDPIIHVSPTSPTFYHVTVTDFCGTQTTDSIFVDIGGAQIDLGPDVSICYGESATLTATPANSYHWSTGETTQSITVSPTQTTTYYVTVTQLCQGSDSITVFVLPLPTITLSVDSPQICEGQHITLTAQGGVSYQWSSNPPSQTLNNISSNIVELTPTASTIYYVTGIDINGCTNSSMTSVTVFPAPQAAFITQPNVANSFDPTFRFYDLSSNNPVYWHWWLSDGSEYFTSSFVHQFPMDNYGQYEVILYVENEAGCGDTVKGYVTVQPGYTLYIPSAFTPNNDEINDYFHISGVNFPYQNFNLWIYNRWGQLVFHTTDPGFSWDGKVDGSPVPDGIYQVKIIYQDYNNIYHIVEQFLTIFR